jgi:hypothetical protein
MDSSALREMSDVSCWRARSAMSWRRMVRSMSAMRSSSDDLIAHGELAAGKGKDGMVYVRESALEDYLRRHPAAMS